MSGEANDAVSACTQVKMSDTSRLLKLLEIECSTVWIRLLRNRRPKHWDNIDDPMVTLDCNLDSNISLSYHSNQQVADILTKVSFAGDNWN